MHWNCVTLTSGTPRGDHRPDLAKRSASPLAACDLGQGHCSTPYSRATEGFKDQRAPGEDASAWPPASEQRPPT